jgi:hypothetical protein
VSAGDKAEYRKLTPEEAALALCGPRDPLISRIMYHPKAPTMTWREVKELTFREVMEITVMLDLADKLERDAADKLKKPGGA